MFGVCSSNVLNGLKLELSNLFFKETFRGCIAICLPHSMCLVYYNQHFIKYKEKYLIVSLCQITGIHRKNCGSNCHRYLGIFLIFSSSQYQVVYMYSINHIQLSYISPSRQYSLSNELVFQNVVLIFIWPFRDSARYQDIKHLPTYFSNCPEDFCKNQFNY